MTLEQQLKHADAPLPARKWTIYAIHHSHTDLGYTDRQEKIEQYHVDFIRQALRIANAAHAGAKPEWKGFRWTCETFWAVEQFLKAATPEEQKSFAEAVLRGDLELSGTYLNMTELPDEELLSSLHSKAQAYAASIGSRVDSAMTADINGYGWGYADSLLNHDIEHLFSCIHTHHGMYALGRKQAPFWWETRDGRRLLVWNGEHYMIGNELGLCPGALGKYMIRDEFNHQLVEPEAIHDGIATVRIRRYLAQLEAEQYPYAFVPVMLSGLGTDNGAPNSRIIEWIQAWNEQHGDLITIEMTSLSGFFARLKQEDLDELPVHRGDWPDWWTDGVSSTPMHTQVFRDAQRTLRKAVKLDAAASVLRRAEIDETEEALALYAEHTWGYHSSIYEPWHKNVQLLEVRKLAHAAEASRLAYRALDKVLLQQGSATLYPDRPYRFRVSNLAAREVTELVTLQLDGWEPGALREGVEVVREDTGEVLPQQSVHPHTIVTELKLQAQETCFLLLRPLAQGRQQGTTTTNTRLIGADQVYDMDDMFQGASGSAGHPPIRMTRNGLESPFVRLSWSDSGIHSWFNKELDTEMLRSGNPYGAFTPIYEVTRPADETDASQVWSTRARMGRNRKGLHAERSAGRITSVRTVENGPLYATVEITYQLNGLSYFALFLRVHANRNRVDVSARFHKDSVWSPENVFLSLPFTSGDTLRDTLYADKPGGLVRPWKDQIPGTCLDYACVQEGIAWQDDRSSLLLASPDTPLMQWGPLEYGTRRLHTQQAEDEKPESYAWLMTNYWETNFKATLGGFYEFQYHVSSEPALPEDELAAAIRALHEPFVVCRMRPEGV